MVGREPTLTHSLTRAVNGDDQAQQVVFESIYSELKKIARSQRRGWQGDATINTTALIHEAYLKLVGADDPWQNRKHFFATAARAMRQVLVSYARNRQAAKRGGGEADLSTDRVLLAVPDAPVEILALDEAMTRLEHKAERQCRVVECRFFAGMTVDETADALGVSAATVKREWLLATVELHALLTD